MMIHQRKFSFSFCFLRFITEFSNPKIILGVSKISDFDNRSQNVIEISIINLNKSFIELEIYKVNILTIDPVNINIIRVKLSKNFEENKFLLLTKFSRINLK